MESWFRARTPAAMLRKLSRRTGGMEPPCTASNGPSISKGLPVEPTSRDILASMLHVSSEVSLCMLHFCLDSGVTCV